MRIDIKSFIAGIVFCGVIIAVLGASKTQLEEQIYREIADRAGHLVLIDDANGDVLVVNKETATAKRIQYKEVNRPHKAVKTRLVPVPSSPW